MRPEAQNQAARQAILARVRQAINAPDSPRWGRERQFGDDWQHIARGFRRNGTFGRDERIAMFRSRLDHYGAPSRVTNAKDASAAVGDVLRERGKRTLVVTPDVQEDWVPRDLELRRDSGLSNDELNRLDGVITGCTIAIALTGTIILSSRNNGRRALTLVPDYELCIVREDQIVELVPDVIEALRPAMTTPLTFFSGPSATVDIEMIRVQGVHGPRVLDVVILA